MQADHIHVEEFYVSRVNWLISQGRDELIDPIADEFERRTALNSAEIGVDRGWQHRRAS